MIQLGLIGNPVKHSLSPWIHDQFFKKANLNGIYDLYEIKKDNFHTKLDKIKQDLDGFNVTLPYKQRIVPYINKLDATAEYSGAVNTVTKIDNQWVGYNTDGIGYIRSLEVEHPNLFLEKQLKVLILGAGGAARGIFHALSVNGMNNIDIANRSIEKALNIAANFKTNTQILTLSDAQRLLHIYDLIIQTTSVGMKPNELDMIIPIQSLKKNVVVSDIVYQPLSTRFLKAAKNLGAQIHHGHTMLLYQALFAFEIWTGKNINISSLEQKLKNKLKGN